MIHEIDIDLPVNTVYNQWTQFEDFPLFMKHVVDVRQIDDTHTAWKAKISGISREWQAEITEQTPDQRVAWTATDGTENSGVVTFHALDDNTTRVVLQMETDPKGFLEKVADWGGYISDRSKKDLEQFKDFIEARGKSTGAWRGQVERDSMRDLHSREDELRQLSDHELAKRAEDAGLERPLDRNRDWLVSALARDGYERRTGRDRGGEGDHDDRRDPEDAHTS
ncbi:MAG TPA: SRPBCC family protein [Acidimicrobiales bacterium]|nr:SRPBCC family protein [Acidimicrobiales bacterium]